MPHSTLRIHYPIYGMEKGGVGGVKHMKIIVQLDKDLDFGRDWYNALLVADSLALYLIRLVLQPASTLLSIP